MKYSTKTRIQKSSLPNVPTNCPLPCVYRPCDSPRINKGNSDATCHKLTNKSLLATLLLLLLIVTTAHAKLEKDYNKEWCRGQLEVILPDNTRADCVTDTHAIEVEYDHKFYEAIGQSLYYSMQTGKRAGILLIVQDRKYWYRLNSVIQHFNLPIDTWEVAK